MKKIVLPIATILLISLSVYLFSENKQLKEDNKVLEIRNVNKTQLLIESRYETKVFREFLQKSNHITKNCRKCKEKVLFELSEDFDKFMILTK